MPESLFNLSKMGGVTTPAILGPTIFGTPQLTDPFAGFGGKSVASTETKPAPKPVTQPTKTTTQTGGSADIAAALEAARQQALKIQSQVDQLAKDQQPTTPPSSFVASSDSAVNAEKQTTADIAKLSIPDPNTEAAKKASDDYIKLIEEQMKALEAQRTAEIASINASFDETKRQTEEEQKREKGTTNVALFRVGGYLGTQVSAVGVLNNLAQTHRNELSALEGKRQSVIQAASSAINDKQFALARAKAQEVKDLDKEINDRRNKFFEQSMSIVREQRLEDQAAEQRRQNAFKNSLDTIGRVAPTILEDINGLDEATARDYILGAAKDLQLDPNLLIGEVNALGVARRETEQKEVTTLASKYPSADINPDEDSFTSATDKIRNSREYKLDIQRAELDIANTHSLISQRAADAAVDYSDPLLRLYTQATNEVVSSPSKARAVMGYADSLLSGKEVMADDYIGPLLDNQIHAKDAQKLVTDAFASFGKNKDSEIPDSTVWQWLSTEEARDLSDDEKKTQIMQAGKNPEDFGIY